MKKKPRKRKVSVETRNKHLRSGSKLVKQVLLQQNPHCIVCGSDRKLQLHHIYLVRHGFATKVEHSCLMCANCHRAFHRRWDEYLDITFEQNPNANFLKIFEVLTHI